MSVSMPRPLTRSCETCGHSFYTVIVGEMACPRCWTTLPAVVAAEHVCPRGHAQQHGGDCVACATNGVPQHGVKR